MNRKGKLRSQTNGLVIILSMIFCLAVLGCAGYIVHTHSSQSVQAATQAASLVAEENVKIGTINSNSPERQKEMDQVVEEGRLAFSINATPFMKNGTSTANLMIENPPNNGKRFTITIQRDDTGEEIYHSGYLDPEQYIDEVPLDVEMEEGEYPCTAYFDSYRISDNSYLGRAGAQITLYVLE